MANAERECTGVLVTIGDEILLGDIPNGNAHHIAAALRGSGFRVHTIVTVGDREDDIIEVLRRSLARADFLIATGGLGPTEDDRTVAAVAKAFHLPLAADRDYRLRLQKCAAERGSAWSDELERLTQLPAGSVKIGMEMAGFSLEHQAVPCYFLPGVPSEMRQLLAGTVIPDLRRRFPRQRVYIKHVLRVQELPESVIGQRLSGMPWRDAGIEIGYLPQGCENWVTLLATAENEQAAAARLAEARARIIDRLGAAYVSGVGEDTLETVIGRQLRDKGWTLAVAESCTGGLLSARITAVAGASDYFERAFITYSNAAKTELLNVPQELLARHGAVSEPVARAMADGVRKQARVDAALAVTGIAGPSGGSPEKPVGTVFIAGSTARRTTVEKHFFTGPRGVIQEHSAQAALVLLWRILSRC